MGRRGPAPEPTVAKLARGETRPSRLNRREPIPASRVPRLPSDMEAAAKTVWRRVMENAPRDLIVAADTDLLRAYCEAVARLNTASRQLAVEGLLVEARGDHPGFVRNPLVMVVKAERDAVRLLARELGLSPAARAGLQVSMEAGSTLGIDDVIGPPPRLLVVGGGDD